jgi:hypothetical protein
MAQAGHELDRRRQRLRLMPALARTSIAGSTSAIHLLADGQRAAPSPVVTRR